MKTRTIELSEPIGAVTKITLREPRYADFVELGPPAQWVSLSNGAGFLQETPAILGQWIERLMLDVDPASLQDMSLRDTLAIRAAVFEFFYIAAAPPPLASDEAASINNFRIN
jgi:hypothetical protein